MVSRPLRLVLALSGMFLLVCPHAYPQGRRGMGVPRVPPPSPPRVERQPKPSAGPRIEHNAPLEQFTRMTPDERQRELAKLPPNKRQKIEKQLQQYDRLTPAQKAQLEWFSHLSPDRQNSFRKAFKRFQNQPAGRQQPLRDELNRLSALPAAERTARLKSPEFKSQFNKGEQQILSEMSDMLAAR